MVQWLCCMPQCAGIQVPSLTCGCREVEYTIAESRYNSVDVCTVGRHYMQDDTDTQLEQNEPKLSPIR